MPTKDQMLKERLFAPDDVAAYYNISRRTVYNLVKIGALRTIRIGGVIRFRPSDIEEYAASQTEPSISDMAKYTFSRRNSQGKTQHNFVSPLRHQKGGQDANNFPT